MLILRVVLLRAVSVAAASLSTPPPSSVVISCGSAFDDRLSWLCSLRAEGGAPLLRVEEIGPADSPRYAVVCGGGLSLYLCRDAPAVPLSLRLPAGSTLPPGDGPPAGCSAHVPAADPFAGFDRTAPLPLQHLPRFRPRRHVSRAAGAGGWGVGRAGMLYRDLLPDRAGGSLIVSLIRIEEGGEVPDWVHYHRVRFQLIYIVCGWVEAAPKAGIIGGFH
ncbi:hypothetical protein EMIHUDRAFT_370456, partial [Emiliania huxleyi CCMP1516]|uniref:Uncharacterized protein n=2 Tax=Emiliania huxleyi TaxID=2903 RepID=A0A0D3IY15_EMIH1